MSKRNRVERIREALRRLEGKEVCVRITGPRRGMEARGALERSPDYDDAWCIVTSYVCALFEPAGVRAIDEKTYWIPLIHLKTNG